MKCVVILGCNWDTSIGLNSFNVVEEKESISIVQGYGLSRSWPELCRSKQAKPSCLFSCLEQKLHQIITFSCALCLWPSHVIVTDQMMNCLVLQEWIQCIWHEYCSNVWHFGVWDCCWHPVLHWWMKMMPYCNSLYLDRWFLFPFLGCSWMLYNLYDAVHGSNSMWYIHTFLSRFLWGSILWEWTGARVSCSDGRKCGKLPCAEKCIIIHVSQRNIQI